MGIFALALTIGPTSVRWHSASRECLLFGSSDGVLWLGTWRPERCCKNSRVIGTGSIMLSSMPTKLASYQEAAIVSPTILSKLGAGTSNDRAFPVRVTGAA